jgi:hypothetical protein
MSHREGIMRPRPEVEKEIKNAPKGDIPNYRELQMEILLDIREILLRIEREQPLSE